MNKVNEFVLTVLCSILMFFCTGLTAQPVEGKYANFTPERQIVLEKMGKFFDETIRENFPAETDTLSYKAFFRCIFLNADYEYQYILPIDRKKLAEINAELFKDEIYYFFYARYLTIPVKDSSSDVYEINAIRMDYPDSIPTIKNYVATNFRRPEFMWWWYSFPRNPYSGGYLQQLINRHPENPVVCEVDTVLQAMGGVYSDFNAILFISNVLYQLHEISDPVVKQLAAVVFWRYICFCGGVDLINRKIFCDECVSVELPDDVRGMK
jgi:hypothetical protein